MLDELYKLGVMSVLVEAGGKFCGSMLKYADKIYQFIAPKVLGDNEGKSCFDFKSVNSIAEAAEFRFREIKNFSPDILITYTAI